ncbi:iron chelate uptake ABC transporter family permease subunit [Paenibacillus sp. GCM10023250]|uniref:iron chelate uptake ABC transporter family permease subunit n=1 Tax=Paenibacillus sp. GCM10023250 TaxID=3252648 RepID=UPI0036168ABD
MKSSSSIRSNPPPLYQAAPKKPISFVLPLAVIALTTMLAGASLGDMRIHPFDVILALFCSGSEEHELVVLSLRLPRIVVGFLVGMALAAAGSILQGIIRNPLASPDMIGITSGASVAAVAFISYLSGTVGIIWLPAAAMAGAAVAAILIYLLAWKRGVTSIRLVLVGIGINFLLAAGTKVMLLKNPEYSCLQ